MAAPLKARSHPSRWAPVLASALAYCGLAVFMGRDALGTLGSSIYSDAGDPVLVAAILAWNARHVPWTQAWWNFPAFHPTPDTLAFSENLLGISVIAAPVQWLTGNALATYNVMVLASFPLCAMAMYALVYRLTHVAPAAFLAGLAYGFAPYRISHLPHLQVIAAFWMPVALLGLHAFLESGRRRWLAVFAAAWLLQGLTNGYYLVFFSLFVGLWVVWFVVIARRWRALWAIAAGVAIAAVPLAITLHRYLRVHARHGFGRDLFEVQSFSADVASVLCAPANLAVWSWLQVGCRPEGQLYPGAALVLLCTVGSLLAWRTRTVEPVRMPRPLAVLRRLCWTLTVVYVVVAASVWILGHWELGLGGITFSASNPDKHLSVSLLAAIVAVLLGPRLIGAARRSSIPVFYAIAAVVAWTLTLGPSPTLLGTRVLQRSPYWLLMHLPGLEGLRVPSRFWMMTVIALSTIAGLSMAAVLKHRSRRTVAVVVLVAGIGLVLDGWTASFPVAGVPAPAPSAARLAGTVVLELPLGTPERDAGAVFRAVTGGWRSVNGYSGFEPAYYQLLRVASREEDGSILETIRGATDLNVIVLSGATRLREMTERQPGASLVADNGARALYRLPRAPAASDRALGPALPVRGIDASCRRDAVEFLSDRDLASRWACEPQASNAQLVLDLGAPAPVGGVVHELGEYAGGFPGDLLIETSFDGSRWQHAWQGAGSSLLLAAAMRDPIAMPLVVTFGPRTARYVRLRQIGRDPAARWSVAELTVRGPAR